MDRTSVSLSEFDPAVEGGGTSFDAVAPALSGGALQDAASLFKILRPPIQLLPIVAASAHSGAAYPVEFVALSRLDPLSLRKSEDSFIDEIFADAPELGAPLLSALFPRAFVDPNREPYETRSRHVRG